MKTKAFEVLEILEREGAPLSGEEISSRLGITRSAVWKHVSELRDIGYGISASRQNGYLLEKRTELLLPYEIRKNLRTKIIGRDIRQYDSIPSTTWVAKELLADGEIESRDGTVLIAEEQTGGVGRLGRAWISPRGGIWTTIILTPKVPLDHLCLVTMAASNAVARTIRKQYDLGALIKWPNDIYIGDKKVSGILLEISAESDSVHYCLLSIGIDANIDIDHLPGGLQTPITSLSEETGSPIDRAEFFARMLREFERRYLLIQSGEYESIIREWKSLSITLEHRVHITTPRKTFVGEAIDIDKYGALIVRKDNGKIEKVISGDCSPI